MSLPPRPWQVAYIPGCEEWHPRCCPIVIDWCGNEVCRPTCNVDHPGLYDESADNAAYLIVSAVNRMAILGGPHDD